MFHKSRSLLVILSTLLLCGSLSADQRPNIVLILADDLGWSDLGCYGGDLIESPHLDGLARDGMQFTSAYAMPVCSPSRAALLTGRHAARLHMTIWSEEALAGGPRNERLLQGDSLPNLPHSEVTLAKHLQNAGYLTAMIGKWHLGDADHSAETHGFDINIGGTHWGAPTTFWWPYRGAGRFGSQVRYVPHLEFGKPGEYLTDRLTDEALNVIDQAGERPFFLYLSQHAPHTPIEAKQADVEYFQARLKPEFHHQNPYYAAMVKSLDESVGRILAKLQERGIDQNTIVIFASDNGGYIGTDSKSGQTMPVTDNWPLRSGKGSCYEGGIRIPLLIRWPGVTKPQSVSSQPVAIMDLFTTILQAAAVETAAERTLDSLDLTPILRDPKLSLKREGLYFHYPHYYATTTPVSAIRAGDWKLLEYFEDDRVELYNLIDDPGESNNLAMALPDESDELKTKLRNWRDQVNASLPKKNPSYRER